MGKLKQFWENTESARNKLKSVYDWAYSLRSVLLAIPVIVGAIWLAIQNLAKLPEQVGINMLSSGEYEIMVGRGVAVLCPLAITALCLLLMFCSRRVVYPWLISLFSLVIPLVILITNTFPA